MVHWMKKTNSLIEDKRKTEQGQEGYLLSEPKKAHPTGEFVIVT